MQKFLNNITGGKWYLYFYLYLYLLRAQQNLLKKDSAISNYTYINNIVII